MAGWFEGERRARRQKAARFAAVATLSCAAACALGISFLDSQSEHGGRDELIFCATPPCGPYGTVSPSVSFHVQQTMQPGPHPMTYAAIAKSKDATSLARDVQSQEGADKEKVNLIMDDVDDTKEKAATDLKTSRIELWKVIGELRRKIASYKDRLVHAKSQMMSRDNYLAARMHSLKNSITRNDVSVARRANDVKVQMAVVANMHGPPGKDGADGKPGPDGPTGSPGPRGDVGQPGMKGQTGPRGYDGRDGVPGGIGPQGDMGIPGPKGPKGVPGRVGRTGPMGLMGIPGKGRPGPNGPPGPSGPPGYPGVAGPQGPSGGSTPGARGVAGAPGPAGASGQPGPPGAAGPNGPHGIGGGLIQKRR